MQRKITRISLPIWLSRQLPIHFKIHMKYYRPSRAPWKGKEIWERVAFHDSLQCWYAHVCRLSNLWMQPADLHMWGCESSIERGKIGSNRSVHCHASKYMHAWNIPGPAHQLAVLCFCLCFWNCASKDKNTKHYWHVNLTAFILIVSYLGRARIKRQNRK